MPHGWEIRWRYMWKKWFKAVHHLHTDLVQENNKNVLILNPVQSGKKMVQTTITVTRLPRLYARPDNFQISLKIAISFHYFIITILFHLITISLSHQSYEVKRVSKMISVMRKQSQNRSHLKSHRLPGSLRKHLDPHCSIRTITTSLCSYYKHWLLKFQSAWQRTGTNTGFHIYLCHPRVYSSIQWINTRTMSGWIITNRCMRGRQNWRKVWFVLELYRQQLSQNYKRLISQMVFQSFWVAFISCLTWLAVKLSRWISLTYFQS